MNVADVFWQGNEISSANSNIVTLTGGMAGLGAMGDPNLPYDPFSNPDGYDSADVLAEGMPEYTAPAGLTQQQSAQAAAQLVQGSAASGTAVSPAVVQSWQASGIDLSNLVTAAGAAYSLTLGPTGYVATPTNAAAQAAILSQQNIMKYAMYAGAALLAFFLLKKA